MSSPSTAIGIAAVASVAGMPVRARRQRAADTRRDPTLLLRDGDDVALRLALDDELGPRVEQGHQAGCVQANEHDVTVLGVASGS